MRMEDKFVWVMGAVLAVLIAIALFIVYAEDKSCQDQGGTLQGSGEYTTHYVLVNNVMIPSKVENLECVK